MTDRKFIEYLEARLDERLDLYVNVEPDEISYNDLIDDLGEIHLMITRHLKFA